VRAPPRRTRCSTPTRLPRAMGSRPPASRGPRARDGARTASGRESPPVGRGADSKGVSSPAFRPGGFAAGARIIRLKSVTAMPIGD
jgi:hypothetical protein